MSDHVSIRNAHAHNLKNVNVSFRKGAFTVVTGISGSGKSSLVRDVLEADAKRKFLESLSMYERQSVHEGPEAPVDSVSGLGVTVSITPGRRLYSRRSTVGIATEIWHHLAVLLASIGERKCLKCDSMMNRNEQWICLYCGAEEPLAEPRHFSPSTYTAACPKCHGVKTLQVPAPEKLIVNPDKPLCRGAMYSPGFFPKGYLCKPFNGGYYMVQAVAARYGFDPTTTPWKEMTVEAQKAFLFGDQEPLTVTFESRRRPPTIRQLTYRGFYGWVRDWDVGGTYTKTEPCDQCGGSGFRPEYLAVTLEGQNIHQLSEMPLSKLQQVLGNLPVDRLKDSPAASSLQTALKRLRFLQQVGLAYLNLNRITATLSAGEAQRIRLASLLGSGLTSLTILLDEPSRGMHPSEVKALTDVLKELRTEGNTVIAVEHDPVLIRSADEIVDVGPGAGANGGRVVAQGRLEEVAKAGTLTAKWLGREGVVLRQGQPREPRGWLTIKGARGNNLQIDTAKIPLGVLVGLCGVSGSGKSTLLIDTVGRALAPRKITTSVAHEPIEPEKYGSIEGALERTVVLDQARRGIRSPMDFLDLLGRFARIFSESGDAKAMDLGAHELGCGCTACNGTGTLRTDMGFLPDAFAPCEACKGTGLRPEALEVHVNGVSFSELGSLTIDEARCLFGKFDSTLARKLDASRDVGLGYLVLRQPGHTLSGGEIQRLQIAGELATGRAGRTLYILDEPTVGQHMEDVERLVGVLGRLVDEGHSVVVAEHSPQLLSACDWLIELGPGGGPDGGYVVAAGPPEAVAKMKTPTAPYLKEYLEGRM